MAETMRNEKRIGSKEQRGMRNEQRSKRREQWAINGGGMPL